jgi:pimeloyl-ACP methyl ester carboxylesterase
MNKRYSDFGMNRGRRTLENTVSSLPGGELRLRDGRRLAYAEYGDPQGKPVFFFHGTPGSRLFHHPDTSVAASTGARIIAIDRPGFGRSDFKLGRTLLDWPDDVVELADALNIERFAVMGYSGGGPYAAVCALKIPDRLTAAGLVSSMAPLDNPHLTRGMHGVGHMFFSLDRHVPPLAKLGCWLMCTSWRHNPELYYKSQINGLLHSEKAQILLPKMRTMLTTDFLEAVRAGTQGISWDLALLAQPWGFHLHAITTDVFLWHGESDTQTPLAMGKRLASAIPHCRATFFPGEGHWAIYSHWQEILTALVQSEAVAREEPQLATIAVATQNNNSGPETVILPECSDIAIADTPADSSQGLQPARDVAEKSTEARTTILADTPASVSPEPEPVPEAPKPVSRKTARRRTAATADSPTKASDKMKPAPEKPKSAAGRTARRSVAATADARTDDSSEPKPLPDKAKVTAKRPAKPSATVIDPLSVGTPEGPHPAQKPAEPTSKKPSSGRKAVKEVVLV